MYKKLYDYLPRNEILKKITVPRSDAACIIVPPNKEGIGFVCKSFGKGLRNRDLDQERF